MKIRFGISRSSVVNGLFGGPEQRASAANTILGVEDNSRAVVPTLRESPVQGFQNVKSIVGALGPEGDLVVQNGNRPALLEDFHLLSHRLWEARQHRPLRKVLVTSAIPKEGKTMIAINVAIALARTSSAVLLIDGDMRAPDVHRVLGVPGLPGLAEVLQERVALSEHVKYLAPSRFYYLAAGQAHTNPSELLQQSRMRELMQEAESAFEWIVIDSPPMIPFADAHCLSALSDGILWVVRSGMTPLEDLEQALACLNGTHVIGFILNGHDDSRRGLYHRNYAVRRAE